MADSDAAETVWCANSNVRNNALPDQSSLVLAREKLPSNVGEYGYPMSYYEQLMRHDWHAKTHRRIRQKGWGP